LSQISQKSFEDGETSPVFCFKLPFLLSNGQNDAESHGFVITRAKKEAPATTTSALIFHQLFEQILYIPLIVFSFPHQPTDTVCLIPLLQKLGERPIECGLPTSITPRFCCMVSAALRIDSPSEKRFRKRSA